MPCHNRKYCYMLSSTDTHPRRFFESLFGVSLLKALSSRSINVGRGSDASFNKLFNFLSLSLAYNRWQEVFVFVSRHGLLIYFSPIWRIFRGEEARNWCFIWRSWLLKKLYLSWIWRCRRPLEEKHKNVKRNDLSFDIYLLTIYGMRCWGAVDSFSL